MKRKILDFFRQLFKLPIFEQVLVGMTKGKEFGNWITKIPPNHYQYSVGTYRKVNRDGINYHLDLSDIVDWYIYFGFIETSKTNLYDLIQKGMTVIDVGANVGDVSMHAAKLLEETGRVYSFEPDPTNFQRLQKNLSSNSFNNIEINELGLGDKAGSFRIAQVSEGNRGMNRIIVDNNLNGKEIQVISLDSYVEKKQIKSIDLIKMDVEGFEYNVLMGSQLLIDRLHPILFIELDDENLKDQGSSAQELIEFLLKKGYELYHGETKEPIGIDTNFSKCHFDIIAK